MLRVDDVVVAFGDRVVLDHVSLGIARGEIVALTGPSGSGKSTLLRVVAGLQPLDGGRVLLDGDDVTGVPTHRRSVGMVFQDNQLFPHRSVGDNVGFGLRMQRTPRRDRQQRVADLLHLVGLDGFEGRSPDRLSGGEAKRVALARALAPSPRVLLLDEPLTGLDVDLHADLAGALSTALRSTGTTALLVTHDLEEAVLVADRIVRLEDLCRVSPPSDGAP